MSGEKVVLGLSGGVDSAAAAMRLRDEGYAVCGVWLDLGFGSPDRAAEAAAQLGIAFSVWDAAAAHEALVRAPFAAEYAAGRTPNPCAVCNPAVKLPSLLRAAEALGADQIATGHYAAVETRRGRPCLRESGGDKDQSYMLAMVSPELLGRLRLPLSGLTKPEIRALAARAGLAAASAPDSQDICFIPDGDYGRWLEERGAGLPAGNFTDAEGRVLGRHRGLHRYTVGQRRGLGVSAETRLYVCALRRDTNTVVLGPESALLTREVRIRGVLWGASAPSELPLRCEIRLRSRPAKSAASVSAAGDGLLLRFDAPLRRPSPGQLAVGYDGEGFVLFAGIIEEGGRDGENDRF